MVCKCRGVQFGQDQMDLVGKIHRKCTDGVDKTFWWDKEKTKYKCKEIHYNITTNNNNNKNNDNNNNNNRIYNASFAKRYKVAGILTARSGTKFELWDLILSAM